MKILETILNFLTRIARIIFPRKKKCGRDARPGTDTPPGTDAPLCVSTHPLPEPPIPPLPVDGGDGGDAGSLGGDTLALEAGHWGNRGRPPGADWLGIGGYTLMLSGCMAWILERVW